MVNIVAQRQLSVVSHTNSDIKYSWKQHASHGVSMQCSKIILTIVMLFGTSIWIAAHGLLNYEFGRNSKGTARTDRGLKIVY